MNVQSNNGLRFKFWMTITFIYENYLSFSKASYSF